VESPIRDAVLFLRPLQNQMLYLKQFVVGSSVALFWPFFLGVQFVKEKRRFSFETYSLTAPLVLGFWNVLSYALAQRFDVSMRIRFLILSLVSYVAAVGFVRTVQAYNFSPEEWKRYYLVLFVIYFLSWNVVAFYIEKAIS